MWGIEFLLRSDCGRFNRGDAVVFYKNRTASLRQAIAVEIIIDYI